MDNPLATPFRGERFTTTTQLRDLLSPPYDVLDAAERAVLAERHPNNIVRLILPEGSASDRYQAAADQLADWRAREVVAREPAPAVYVVQQEFTTPDGATFVRTGVICAVAAEPYATGRVRPHERTHRGPKEDRLALLKATRVQSEAIFLVSPDPRGHLRRRLEGVTRHEPHATAELDGAGIALWVVRGAQAREIAHGAGQPLYIADGHHRYETAAAAAADDPAAGRIPALIVPATDPGLVVLPTHRIVRGAALDADAVHRLLARHFAVEERPAEVAPHGLLSELDGDGVRCVVLVGGRVLMCSAPGDGRLPLEVIEERVVEPIRDLAGGTVAYSPQAGAIVAEQVDAAAGVLVPPTPLATVLHTADQGGIMPPKSTYFRPKVPSGLVWMPLD